MKCGMAHVNSNDGRGQVVPACVTSIVPIIGADHKLRLPEAPLVVVAAAIVEDGKVLLVSKRAAPDVFYLPGGKPDDGETPLATLARELQEELGVTFDEAEPFAVVEDVAALEGTPMEMHVFLATVRGAVTPRAEIAALAWVGAQGDPPGRLAPAIRNHVLPHLVERGLLTTA